MARTLLERFWAKVDTSGDCWLWIGATNPKGYGRFRLGTQLIYPHRFAYEVMVGPIPDGMQLDHRYTCPKNCVTPSHLRPATHKQNSENDGGLQANNTSGFRGVWWSSTRSSWQAGITHRGQKIHVGYFATPEAANVAVVVKRNELFTHNDVDRLVS